MRRADFGEGGEYFEFEGRDFWDGFDYKVYIREGGE